MQYCNTPLPYINLSPSQILSHRQLRDYLPAHPQHYKLHKEWLIPAAQREQVLAERNNSIAAQYNLTAHNLLPLLPGTHVSIQDGNVKRYKRWNKTGMLWKAYQITNIMLNWMVQVESCFAIGVF